MPNITDNPSIQVLNAGTSGIFTNYIYKAIPLAFDESMSYYETLAGLIAYLRDTVLPVVNNNGDAVAELQNLYIELNDYVTHYFDNLDVQEEINNKLDEMVEDGTFENILVNYLGLSKVYNTCLEMISDSSTLIDNMLVKTLGFYTKNDGGGATYCIKSEKDISIKDLFYVELNNNKFAELINKNDFNVLQLGAKRNTETFDNATIFRTIFSSGLSNTNVYVPSGIYYTTTINYTGNNIKTNGFNLIGIGKPTLKLLHSNVTKTVIATYNSNFTISKNLEELNLINNCVVSTITLRDNKKFYYFKISDKTLIPSALEKGNYLIGLTSSTKAKISDIDTNDPDGDGTARIYLYQTINEKSKNLGFIVSNNNLNEVLGIRKTPKEEFLYLHFEDETIPSYIVSNRQFEQISTGKTARIDSIVTYGEKSFVALNCMPETDIFNNTDLYLESNSPFNINSYSGLTAGMMSLNKYTNSKINGIIFDGNNIKVSNYQLDRNAWNSIITGGCKNIIIENCNFINSIQGGLQIGGMSNANSPITHDYPEDVTINNCYFRNNGRGDLEIIYGNNININNCYGDGTLDIETNGNEVLNNININNCQFYACTPYSPGAVSSSNMINISNSKFITLLAQQSVVVNLSNCMIDNFQPQRCTIKGNNCYINQINGLHGNEFLMFTNCSFYSLYQNNPGGAYGDTKLNLDNCVIDLSISSGSRLNGLKEFKISNSIIISSTTTKNINDVKTPFNCNNVIFKNVHILGGGSNIPTTGSIFSDCSFLANDNSAITTDYIFYGDMVGMIVKDCYIETALNLNSTYVKYINCILNSITQPTLKSRYGTHASGIKTHDNSGISWNWIGTGLNNNKIYFDDIQFNPNVPNYLGVYKIADNISIDTVSDNCRGYYVGNTDLALCRIYYNNNTLAIKQISFS